MAHPVRPSSFVEINNFYTATIYEKGAEICRMLHTILGPEGFRKGTDLYFARHDGQAVTIEDFLAALGDANGQNLGEFLMWYTQAGTPQVKGRGVYDEGKKTYTLTLDQVNPATPGQAEKQALPLPNRMALLGSDGREIPLQLVGEKSAGGRERVIMLRGATETLEFINVPHKPIPSLFRGFSAPIKLQNVYSNDDLQFLIAHDSDEFNRWDASETLLIRTILRLADDVKNKRPLQMPKGIVESYERMLSNNALGGTFRAMAVSIPSYTLLAQFLVPVDVDALVTARGFVEKELAKGLEKTLWRLVEENKQIGTYAYSVEQVGRRKLRNECLFLLGSTESPAAKKAILEQHRTANNMTDEYSALRMLADFDCQEGADAIAAFYKKWQHEKLVIDRWFSVQVASESDDSYNRLKKLVKHPDFHLTNPNRARALLGGFFQNFKQFHHESGRGYKICSEMTIALDRINPMIAARLVRVMAQWRKMDTARQGMMKAELERIQASEGLSVDTSEVVAQLLK
jgi:aminopeptidase N